MSSPMTDDYAGLMAPWKPITQTSMKSITSPRNRIQIDDGVKVSDLLSIIQPTKRKLTPNRKEL